MSDWSNLPEGVVTLVVAKFDGERSDVIRALRGVCKPWSADIAVTKATMFEGAELPVWQVLQKTPKLQSLTVARRNVILDDIRRVKHLVPELKSFVFDNCGLAHCRMPLSECLGKNTRELTMEFCWLEYYSIENLCDFQHLTSLTYSHDAELYNNEDFDSSICLEIFTNLPSLRCLCVSYLTIDLDTEPNLPNVTSLSIEECIIGHPKFLRGLLCLEHLNLKGTRFLDDSDLVAELPVSITTFNICSSNDTEGNIRYEGFARLVSRLPLLSSLHVGGDGEVTDGVLALIGSMPSLTRLSLVDCILLTDEGLMNLARSANLTWLEIKECEDVTQQGVDALRAALPRLEIAFEVA